MKSTNPMLFDVSNLPLLSQRPRGETLSRVEIARRLPNDIPTERRDVAHGLALLWHDHDDAAHEIAQANEGETDHDFLHYLVHRREGDFGNARYWLRGAGRHPCFDVLPEKLESVLTRDLPSRQDFLPNGAWNAFAFLDAVRTGREPELLRAIQAVEMLAFFDGLRRP